MKLFFRTATLSLVAVCALFATQAFASDLSNDLLTPFEPLSNPFGGVEAATLPGSVAYQLKGLLEKCAYSPISGGNREVQHEAAVQPSCKNLLQASETIYKGAPSVGHTLKVKALGINLQIISWDGSNSDGGDEQAIGIYDAAGDRIAVYPSLYVDGNVLDGIAHIVGAALPKVEL